jgi:phosphoglucomutase
VPMHPGRPAESSDLVDVAHLVTAYYTEQPDPSIPEQRVAFGTSEHSWFGAKQGFNDDHIAAIAQAVCEHRAAAGVDGPLYLGRDTHALSEPAFVTVLEVLAANDVDVLVDSHDSYTPTPAISRAILAHNSGRTSGMADGIVVTPRITLPRTAASSTTRPNADRPALTSPSRYKTGPTSCSAPG